MNTLPPQFDEKLIAAQRTDDSLRQQYEREVKAMFEKKLTPVRKTIHVLVGVVSAAMAVIFGVVAITAKELPWESRAAFALGVIFSGAWVFLMFRTLRRGTIDLRVDEKTQAGLGWGFVVVMVTLFMVLGGKLPDKLISISMVVNGLVFLVMAAVFMLTQRINESRIKLEERLLEMQLRIAELSEELKKRP
jgi:predicted membrane channel-forming protein YqfA (hemolysin III family)